MGSSLITKMWKATFIFVASCSTLILADFPFEIRHFNHMTDSKINRQWFDESCYYHCDVYEHMRPIQIMLKDGIDTCPENLLDNKVVMDSKVMYKNWCKQLDVKFCGYCVYYDSVIVKAKLSHECIFNGPTREEPMACWAPWGIKKGICEKCQKVNGKTFEYSLLNNTITSDDDDEPDTEIEAPKEEFQLRMDNTEVEDMEAMTTPDLDEVETEVYTEAPVGTTED